MVEPRSLRHVIPVKFIYLTSLSVWVSACGVAGTDLPAPASKQVKLYQCKAQGDVNIKINAGCVAQLEERSNSDPRKSPLKELPWRIHSELGFGPVLVEPLLQ
jgi:hypothetical protein